jgi:hypothetical protein
MKSLLTVFTGVLALTVIVPAQASRAERKAEALAESAKPILIKGGEKFELPLAYDAAFEKVVTELKKADEAVVVADRDAGLVATDIEVAGGWRQTGTRTVISLTKTSDAVTTVRVTVTEQKRFKALQTEPWSEPKLNADKTARAAATLKQNLEVK